MIGGSGQGRRGRSSKREKAIGLVRANPWRVLNTRQITELDPELNWQQLESLED